MRKANDAFYTRKAGQGTDPGGYSILTLIITLVTRFLILADDIQGFIHTSVQNLNNTIDRIKADSAPLL